MHRESSTDNPWGDFPNTVLSFGTGSGDQIDLCEEIGTDQLDLLRRVGLEGQFGILTAQDPHGETQTPQVNEVLAAGLEAELREQGVSFVRLDACSPDRSHCEKSVAVALERSEVVKLACLYDQLAIFWFDGIRFWIIPAAADAPAMPLPAPRPRQQAE